MLVAGVGPLEVVHVDFLLLLLSIPGIASDSVGIMSSSPDVAGPLFSSNEDMVFVFCSLVGVRKNKIF